MDLFALTRRLIDIESITPNESAVGDFLCAELGRRGFDAQKMPVEGARGECAGYLARDMIVRRLFFPRTWIQCRRSLLRPRMMSAYMGAVLATRKGLSQRRFWRRRSCAAAGVFVGLLFLVGEERDSIGAQAANQHPIGARFMINGEPTENKLALASKGALHVELMARGKMAHSAYPELGESAIDKLVEALHRLHAMKLPETAELAPHEKCGLDSRRARAECNFRFCESRSFLSPGGSGGRSAAVIIGAVGDLAEVEFTREAPFMRLHTGWTADDGRGLHYRYSVADELGRAAAVWARLDSCGAHRRRVCGEDAAL